MVRLHCSLNLPVIRKVGSKIIVIGSGIEDLQRPKMLEALDLVSMLGSKELALQLSIVCFLAQLLESGGPFFLFLLAHVLVLDVLRLHGQRLDLCNFFCNQFSGPFRTVECHLDHSVELHVSLASVIAQVPGLVVFGLLHLVKI